MRHFSVLECFCPLGGEQGSAVFARLHLQQELLPTASPAMGLGKVAMLTSQSHGP